MQALLGCYWTLAGAYKFGDADQSPWDFKKRAAACAQAGFKGIGLKQSDLLHSLKRYSMADIATIINDNGLEYVELEVLVGWHGDAAARRKFSQDFDFLLEANAMLGAQRIKIVGDLTPDPVPLEWLHACMQPVVTKAYAHQALVALEPLAFSSIKDVPMALAVLGESLGKGAGLMIDAWHVFCGQISFASLEALPYGALAGVELNDGLICQDADPLAQTLNKRLLPGEGEFDLARLISVARERGFTGPWGVEILSVEHRLRDLKTAAESAYQSSRQALQSA